MNTLTSSRTEIKNGQGYKLDRFNQFLTIEDVDVGKAGDYVCKANNSEGSDEATGKIIVAGKFSSSSSNTSLSVLSGVPNTRK